MTFTLRSARRGGFALLAVAAFALSVARPAVAQDKPAENDEKAADANLPDAEVIIAKYIDAMGGKDAMKKLKSYHHTGKISIPAQGITGDIDLYASNENKRLAKFVVPMGQVRRGYDGETAWTIHFSPMVGTKVLEGEEHDDVVRESEFYEFNTYDKFYKTKETVEETDFEGSACYKVKLVEESGKEKFEFFDKATGLLVGSEGKQKIQGQEFGVVSIFSEWKDVEGVKFPTKIKERIPAVGMEQVLAISSTEVNKVEPSTFDLPDEIKALKDKGGDDDEDNDDDDD